MEEQQEMIVCDACGYPVLLSPAEAQAFRRGVGLVGAIALALLPVVWWLVHTR